MTKLVLSLANAVARGLISEKAAERHEEAGKTEVVVYADGTVAIR